MTLIRSVPAPLTGAASLTPTASGGQVVTLPRVLLCSALLAVVLGALAYFFCRPNSVWRRWVAKHSTKEAPDLEFATMASYGSTESTPIAAESPVSWQEDPEVLSLRISYRAIQLGTLLSRGGYGEVYRAQYQDMDVAVKRLLPDRRQQRKQVLLFLEEATLMASLDHERLVSLIGVAWETGTDPRVVVEYMEGGDLQATLTRFERIEHRPHGFDPAKRRIAAQILEGLAFLHSCEPQILHGDLTARNVLLDGDGNAKLSDFNVHRDRMDRTSVRGVHTSLWTAPEVVLGQPYDARSDVFSFGVLLAQLDTHQMPYAHVHLANASASPRTACREILQQVALGRVTIQLSRNVDRRIANLAEACVSLNPQDRPSAEDALQMLLAPVSGSGSQ